MFLPKTKLIVSLLFIVLAASFIGFLIIKKQIEKPKLPEGQTLEELLKELTAPVSQGEPKVSEEIMKSLTAPKAGTVSEDIIKSLTAPK